MGRPIATNASVGPPAKHPRIATEMQVVFPVLGVFLVVFGRFFALGHPRARGLPTCTRLTFMQAIACVKIGCPIPKMAVIFLFFYSFFCREFPLLPVPVRESPGRQAWGNHL